MEPGTQPPRDPAAADGAGIALLRHLPPEVAAAYSRLLASGDPTAADLIVLAVVREHVPASAQPPPAVLDDSLALMADLGFDSMAIAETVFFLEDLFRVSISNAEVARIRTIGELREFIRHKLAAPAAAAPVPRA